MVSRRGTHENLNVLSRPSSRNPTKCECQTAVQRGIVLTALELLETGFGIENVNRVREAWGVLWMHGRRKDWGGVLGGLAWELIVA